MFVAQQLANRFRGALLGAAIGDVIGADVEKGGVEVWDDLERGLHSILISPYTDATELTLAVGESLVQQCGFDGEHMAQAFQKHFVFDTERSHGTDLEPVISSLQNEVTWSVAGSQRTRGKGTFGSEPALRVTPAALFSFMSLDRTVDMARRTASITHHNELAIEGAVLQASVISMLVKHQTDIPLGQTHLLDVLSRHLHNAQLTRNLSNIKHLAADSSMPEVREMLGNGSSAAESVPAALYCFLRNRPSYVDTLGYAVRLGGSIRTVTALAGALSGAQLGMDAIPHSWRADVRGRYEFQRLADALLVASIAAEPASSFRPYVGRYAERQTLSN